MGRVVLGRVFCGASCLGASCLRGELSVIPLMCAMPPGLFIRGHSTRPPQVKKQQTVSLISINWAVEKANTFSVFGRIIENCGPAMAGPAGPPTTALRLIGLVGWLYLKHFLDVMTSLIWVQVP